MNRVLRFRAWMTDMSLPEPTMRMFYRVQIQTHAPWKWDYIVRGADGTDEDKQYAFDFDAKVMQFTGLLDKNGEEVYEEDIVEYDPGGLGIRAVVKFRDGRFYLDSPELAQTAIAAAQSIEVIGNIYEHKQLLESGE